MNVHDVRSLFEYNRWANARFQSAIERLSNHQLTAPIPSSFPSILATFAHIVAAEWVWLQRWQGQSPGSFPEWLTVPSLGLIRGKLAEVESERASFLASLQEDDLQRMIDYKTLSGAPHRNRLADQCVHVVNHSSYHRGQLTTMFRQVGAEPVATDLILFKREAG